MEWRRLDRDLSLYKAGWRIGMGGGAAAEYVSGKGLPRCSWASSLDLLAVSYR